jgi:hypothetical protein
MGGLAEYTELVAELALEKAEHKGVPVGSAVATDPEDAGPIAEPSEKTEPASEKS